MDKAIAREWRRLFEEEAPHFGKFDEFEKFVLGLPDHWTYETATSSFIATENSKDRLDHEREEAARRKQAELDAARADVEAEIERRKTAWIAAGGTEASFDATRTEAEILREKLDNPRPAGVIDVRDL